MTTPDSPLNFGQNNRFRDVHVGDSARRDVNKNLGDVVYGDKVVQAPFSPRPVAATPEERDAAMQRLAALPTDELPPAAGGLPPGSWLGGLGRNHQFVGREADLLALARMLKGGAHVAVNQAQSALASGLGGIGKTQLAVEFAYRYGPFFSGVFWLNCAQPDLLDTAIARCGGAGHLQLFTEAAGLTLDEQVGLVLARWGGGLPYLLIFDNCEEPELLRRYRPGGASRVLLTSRNAGWPGHLGVQRHPLGVLARAESLALLRQHRPSLNEAEADELARELGDLPLALYLAGRFLAGPGNTLSVARYLAELDSPRLFERLPLRAEDGALPTGHSRDVARTFALSYEQLNTANDSDGLALGLLARAAQLVPGTVVPADLLRATLEPDPDDLEAELATNSALERLLRLGLLEGEGDDSLRMHRLVGAYVGQVAGDNEAQPAVERAVRAWAAVLDAEPSLAPLTAFLPILQGVTDAALPRGDVAAADLCIDLGLHLYRLASYATAMPYVERALAIREQALGPSHPDTATSLNNLANLYYAQGDYAQALLLSQRALDVREQVLGPSHPATATSLNNLAELYRAQGDYAAALPLSQRALAIREQALGPSHPDTARSLNNLAELYRAQGNDEAALPLHERALTIVEQALGPTHPATATSLNNLAVYHYYQGNFPVAAQLMQQALQIREARLGPDHPDTVSSRRSLAAIQERLAGESA